MPELPPPYRLVRPLGRGGMAAVHLAWHEALGEHVAVKMLLPDERRHFPSGAVIGLREEAAMLGRLNHPGIPRLREHIDTDAVKALVMDFIEGVTLDVIARGEARPDAAQLLDWTRQLCGILGYLHGLAAPVIYRDLKPGNIIVCGDGGPGARLVLIDFGIAKVLDEQLRRSTQTTARGMLTRGYAAVEQYIGGTDGRSDIYALGATLHALASGASPPESLAIATGKATLEDLRASRPDLPEALHAAIEAMTRVDRARRPQSVADVLAMLGLEAPLYEPCPPVARALQAAPSPVRLAAPPPSLSDGPATEQTGGLAFDPSHPAAWRPPDSGAG